jgi:hypothetical protein
MNRIRTFLLLALSAFVSGTLAKEAKSVATLSATPLPPSQQPVGRVVELKARDGTILKGSYFAAFKPGLGVLLFRQSNQPRQSWDDIARQLAAAGINILTIDNRG